VKIPWLLLLPNTKPECPVSETHGMKRLTRNVSAPASSTNSGIRLLIGGRL